MTSSFRLKTIYGKREFIEGAKSKVVLSIKTSFPCVFRRLRIDGSERSRKLVGVREVRTLRHGLILVSELYDGEGDERHMSVAALEATQFEEELSAAETFEVEIVTLGEGIEVCLVADVAVLP